MVKRALYSSIAVMSMVLVLAGCTNKGGDAELVLGFNPAESVDVVEANGKALAKFILEKTGLRLKTFVATDSGGLVEAMRSGKVHLAFIPPFALIQAEKVAGAKVLLKAVRGGRAVYYSALITAKDYKSVQDLKGKTMAWTDPSSTTGHIIPKNELMKMGIDPDSFFSKQVFAGGHDALVMAVVNGTVDAGATFCNGEKGEEGAWMQYLKDPAKQKLVRVLHVSQPIPGDAMATTQKFYKEHPDVVEKVTKIMMDLSGDPEGKKILMELYHIDSMVPARSEEYEGLREAARKLGLGAK